MNEARETGISPAATGIILKNFGRIMFANAGNKIQ